MKLEERLDLYTTEMEKIEENGVKDVISKAQDMSSKKVKQMMRDSGEKLKEMVSNQGVEREFLQIINRHLNTNLRSLSDLDKKKIKESEELNEDFKHYGQWIKDNAVATMLIFPGLSIFMELDKLFDNPGDVDFRRIIVYAVFFIFVATGSHITQGKKGKEENPEEFEGEQEPGPFSTKELKKGK